MTYDELVKLATVRLFDHYMDRGGTEDYQIRNLVRASRKFAKIYLAAQDKLDLEEGC